MRTLYELECRFSKFVEITQSKSHYAVKGHSRSSMPSIVGSRVCKECVIELVTVIKVLGYARPQYECQHRCDVAGRRKLDDERDLKDEK